MSMTDPVADMLTRIRNCVRIQRHEVEMPSSRLKVGVADVLRREGFIRDYEVIEGVPGPRLRVVLKYGPRGEQVIQEIQRVSRPGRRVYQNSRELRPVREGLGIYVVSTNQGIFSDREARERKLGGEVLCVVW